MKGYGNGYIIYHYRTGGMKKINRVCQLLIDDGAVVVDYFKCPRIERIVLNFIDVDYIRYYDYEEKSK